MVSDRLIREAQNFSKVLLAAAGVGGVTFGIGTLLHYHAQNEQRRLWRTSPFPISQEQVRSQPKSLEFDFMAEDNNRYFLGLCITAQSSGEGDRLRHLSSIPQVNWQVLSGGAIVNSGDGASETLRDENIQRICRNLGRFNADAKQTYQIRLQTDEVAQLPAHLRPYLLVRPDTRLTQNLAVLHLTAVIVQFAGIYAFGDKVLKGLIDCIRSFRR